MVETRNDRRGFLKTSAGLFASGVALSPLNLQANSLLNNRPNVAIIGAGWRPDIKRIGRGIAIARHAKKFGDVVAICDVDRVAREHANKVINKGKGELYEDYQDVLARKDIDAVLIASPDHWHTKMSIDAMRADKDVYCEKPMTLTIDEGKQIGKVIKETNRVFQVGTQQRSECDNRFLTAVAIVKSGRLGKIKKVTVGIDAGLDGGPFETSKPPSHLNYDLWLGPAPKTAYIKERTHWTFRWWFEYAGGKLMDWGAHHIDIAQWAIGMQNSGPVSIEGTSTFPQELKNGYPTRSDTYNMPLKFTVNCKFPNGIPMEIHSKDNGILFEGEKGRIFVNRGKLTGTPVKDLKENPLPEDAITKLYKGNHTGSHMGNFFECLETRKEPQSDAHTHHRTTTTCHLANIALRLKRKINWNPVTEQIIGDEEANGWLKREQRQGFEIH